MLREILSRIPGASLFSIVANLVKLANYVAGFIRDGQLRSEGESRAVAKSMVALQARLGIMEEIKAETEAMSDEELDRDLMES